MIMPFGKFKGSPIEELESSYLVYCLKNFDMNSSVTQAMTDEIIGRFSTTSTLKPDTNTVKSIYKNLAKKYHPDVTNGNTIAMQSINEFYELLKEI